MIRAEVSVEQAKHFVYDLYGLKATKVSQLNGYDDKNFHVLVDSQIDSNPFIDNVCESGYVLKVVNSFDSEDEARFDAHNALMQHLNKHNILCPVPAFNKNGKPYMKITLSTGKHILWLLEYIDGSILYKVKASPGLFYQVGELAAKLDNALQNFEHQVYHKKIQWSLGSATDIIDYIHAVKDQDKQKIVRNIISEFSTRVLSVENELDKGIIHGDLNEQNIILEKNGEWQVKAVIDFGDAHYGCYLYELALAVVYMIFTSNDINSGRYVVNGYFSKRKILPTEFKLLKICVLARYCQSLVYGAYASIKDPNNAYILTTAKTGWNILEQLSSIPEDDLLNLWKKDLNF